MHAMRLKESVLRLNEQLTGSRLLRGMTCPGGVRFDFDAEQLRGLAALADELEKEFNDLLQLVRANSGLRDRVETTGILKPETARSLGIVGIAGRASGFDHDLRRDFPHDFYDQVQFAVPVFTEGDVRRRMVVRSREISESLGIIRQTLEKLPAGPIRAPLEEVPPDRMALGYVEGWRGEIFHWIHTAPGNRLARCKIKDPSLQNWPAMTEAIQGNIIPDFPVINKSFNLSYSGTDR
jgi:Ni,Fe-hydrogenase III large subunit